MNPVTAAGALVASYLIGSIDFAVVVGRMHGVDIHQVGSGNPGTSNVMRTLGRGPAAMVFVGDTLKGVIAAAIGSYLVGGGSPVSSWTFAAGLAAVLGHCYPVFHGFKGGKGVATAGGVVLYAVPLTGLILTAIWAAIAKMSKVASVASLVVAILSIPLAVWQGARGWAILWMAGILVLVIYRHRGNISRILQRRERKVTG